MFAGLAQLCEFIEDCEHAALATRVLHVLGREAPKTANPNAYIRFVYNRVILETTQVGYKKALTRGSRRYQGFGDVQSVL